jgi:hypothetical protein
MKKIANHPHLVRDSQSGAILNTDQSSYLSAKHRKQRMKRSEDRIASLESDVKQMKEMLQQLLNK